MSDSVAQDSHEAQTHQEGVDHVKQSAGISQQAPASNPGSDDPSGGIPAGSGGETRASGDPEAQTRTETSGSRDDDDSEQRKEGGDTSGEQKKGSSKRENPDAIPSAGGQRLGEAHWGESKVVPDVPPKRDSEAGQGGVSSAGGQPDKQTADNTARNTGGGDASGGGDEGKQKLTDKIKDKLGMGKE